MRKFSAARNLNLPVEFFDFHSVKQDWQVEILEGLQQPQKRIAAKFFYDEEGSLLFNKICELDEYYITRTEKKILRNIRAELSKIVSQDCELIEYGCGSSEKITLLLEALSSCRAYTAIDICKEAILGLTHQLAISYPALQITAFCADFTSALPPLSKRSFRKPIGFFPGSSIGNFTPSEAKHFLKNIAQTLGKKGGLIIGVDLKKDANLLHRAYNDSQGVTAAFNKNILSQVNRICGTEFDLAQFEHVAFYNFKEGRIEMHLRSLCDQKVWVNAQPLFFKKGETIHTENSYKYSCEEFTHLASQAGFEPVCFWQDENKLFSIHYLKVSG